MVVITAWKSKPLGRSRLLKAVCKMTKQLTAEAKINLEDISMIIHGGVYRRHFRTEPAFATHVQGELDLKYSNDGLHLNETGYDNWMKKIKPLIDKLNK